jgi:hypothetical protein
MRAYRRFIHAAREGADLGRRSIGRAPARAPTPLERDYWVAQLERPAGRVASSHLVKYPYSFYSLLEDLADDERRQRVLRDVYHLFAPSSGP